MGPLGGPPGDGVWNAWGREPDGGGVLAMEKGAGVGGGPGGGVWAYPGGVGEIGYRGELGRGVGGTGLVAASLRCRIVAA
jgi:hypothetical protein